MVGNLNTSLQVPDRTSDYFLKGRVRISVTCSSMKAMTILAKLSKLTFSELWKLTKSLQPPGRIYSGNTAVSWSKRRALWHLNSPCAHSPSSSSGVAMKTQSLQWWWKTALKWSSLTAVFLGSCHYPTCLVVSQRSPLFRPSSRDPTPSSLGVKSLLPWRHLFGF